MTGQARLFWRKVHLWLGLTVGALFLLLGVTGSALVFYVEIDTLLHPEIRVEEGASAPDWSSPVWDKALATVRKAWPQDHGQWRFEATGKAGALPARYYPPVTDPAHHASAGRMVWLSADGAKVLRRDRWGDYAMTWIYDLHMQLLAGETGHRIVGWSGIAMLVLLLTGLVSWWPRGHWRKAMAFKPKAAPTRRLYDLHKLTGLWSVLLLFLLVLTGVMLALPDESNTVLAKSIGPVDEVPSPSSTISGNRAQISIQAALDAGHRALPDARLAWIEAPMPGGSGVFRLRVQVPGDPSRRFPHSYVYVDQYSGDVLAIMDARNASASTTINNWLHALHDASVGGLPTRILGLVVGFAPAVLFITGLLRWRRRGKRVSRRIPL